MRTIYKFQLKHEERLLVPEGAKILDFQMQHSQPTAWFEVNTLMPCEVRHLMIIGTGHEIPEGFEYIATTQDPPFVWHLYEKRAP